jgi:hypothetical protein
MIDESEKERQVLRRHSLLIQRKNEMAASGVNQKVRVLHSLRNALVGKEVADVVEGQKGRKLLGPDVGVNGH